MCGCRQSNRRIFKQCILLIAVCASAIICVHVHSKSSTYNSQNLIADEPETKPTVRNRSRNRIVDELETKATVRIKRYDVLLNSYMRGGSTLTGIILGFRKDTFYLYEPLWKISRWTYWHGNDTVCRADRLDCRKVDPRKVVLDRTFHGYKYNGTAGSLDMAMKILRQIYDCQFNDFERTVVGKFTIKNGGTSWSEMAECIKTKGNRTSCLHRDIPRKCENANHRVTKVLRLSTDLLADILHARENLKVIHLFRDPRAIINSRINTKWYLKHTEDGIIENAKSLCSKMLYDFREGQKLLKRYPDRFKFIYYEDLNENPLDKSKELFKYLGMDLDENKYPKVRKLSVFKNTSNQTDREKNTAFWWRMSLKWGIVQEIDSVCKDVYKKLGYKSFKNLKEYQNMSMASVNIPTEYLML